MMADSDGSIQQTKREEENKDKGCSSGICFLAFGNKHWNSDLAWHNIFLIILINAICLSVVFEPSHFTL